MEKIIISDIASPLGIIQITVSEKGLQSVKILNKKSDLKLSHDKGLKSYSSSIENYLKGMNTKFDLPIDIHGTEFQKKVWKETAKIPYGKTVSYETIAKKIGRPKAVRAVGTALGKNPVCIVVPCHRVLPKNGGIGQYAYGPSKKKWLLDLESGRNHA